jgi:hypothetical protein
MKPFTRTTRLSLHCICDYRIISYSDFTSIVRSPFSILHSSSFSFSPLLSTPLGSNNLANLAGARLFDYTRPLERVSPLLTAPAPSKTTTTKAKVIKIQVIQANASAATIWLQWIKPLDEQFRPSTAAE